MGFKAVSQHELTDRDLERFWHDVRESGRAGTLFYDRPPLTDEGFRGLVRSDGMDFWLLFAQKTNTESTQIPEAEPSHPRSISIGSSRTVPQELHASNASVCAGAFWLTERRGRHADVHFFVMPMGGIRRDADGVPLQIATGRFALGYLFGLRTASGAYAFDSLTGLTPKCNASAVKFAERLGGKVCGCIENGAYFCADDRNCDLVITSYRRQGG